MIVDRQMMLSVENKNKLALALEKYKKDISMYQKKQVDLKIELGETQEKKAIVEKEYQRRLQEYNKSRKSSRPSDLGKDEVFSYESIQIFKRAIHTVGSKYNLFVEGKSSEDSSNDRKKVTIILRPTASKIYHGFEQSMKDAKTNNNLDSIRMEQLLLLALYPAGGDEVVSASPSEHGDNKEWIEPGSRLRLDISEAYINSSILPRSSYDDKIFRDLHSEHASSKGHQACTLMESKHYRRVISNGSRR